MRRPLVTTPLILLALACQRSTELDLVLISSEDIAVRSARLSVDSLVLEGCEGASGESIVLAHTFDLLRPEALRVPRGDWCELALIPATSATGVLVVDGLTADGASFRLHTNPPRARLGETFTLGRAEQVLVIDAARLLDAPALEARAAELRAATEGDPTTEALHLELDRDDPISRSAGEALGDALWLGELEAASRRYGDRWPFLAAEFEPEAELPREEGSPADEEDTNDDIDDDIDDDTDDGASDTWPSGDTANRATGGGASCGGGGCSRGCGGCAGSEDTAADSGGADEDGGCDRDADTAGLGWPIYASGWISLLHRRRRHAGRRSAERGSST
jgi:hypothetical protein